MTASSKSTTDTAIGVFLSFDYQQRSNLLRWHAYDDNDDSMYKSTGPAAGALWLTAGAPVSVVVTGGGMNLPGQPQWKYELVECWVITYPEMKRMGDLGFPTFAEPSPFVGQSTRKPGSVMREIEGFAHQPMDPNPDDWAYTYWRYRSDNALRVIPPTPDHPETIPVGRWAMTFVVTVKILPGEGDPYMRVFRSDPETEVGNGVVGGP